MVFEGNSKKILNSENKWALKRTLVKVHARCFMHVKPREQKDIRKGVLHLITYLVLHT